MRPNAGVSSGRVAAGLAADYPILWQRACDAEHVERLGGLVSPLDHEAAKVMRELSAMRTSVYEETFDGQLTALRGAAESLRAQVALAAVATLEDVRRLLDRLTRLRGRRRQ
jgi:predicted component of type VI protein secretion system